ncbi:MocR-like pyridoxine biosynthesis transcription factor PdxR [Paenibacillus glufosinatiresistens]|uniref:MocR-like pyridoxine biosynthesis transcription factor PdxR n=1 Tax=Paenibacillus glufosinatiresistens TaxID=3070657 RepID=UPI00286D9F0D|nr:PLP-dependent aminotransferase family protein [Paenibacillus sp. YX.27]
MWDIELKPQSETGLSVQIFRSFRNRMLSGRIQAGEALPSTRELARSLGVSRNTVTEAYERLVAEGYAVTSQGAPTRVAEGLRTEPGREETEEEAQSKPADGLPDCAAEAAAPLKWDFKTGQPDLTRFPWKSWTRALREAQGTLSPAGFGYGDPQGYGPLRTEIAGWLLRSRGIEADPADICITSGSTQALYLLAGILHKEGCPFALEDPSHPGIRTIMQLGGRPVHWMPVDDRGARVDTLEGKPLSAVYVTPSHQFPLGGILPASRRASLVRMAAEGSYYVIEDDYDSEFRYRGAPVSPLYEMDPSRVVYVGTFSKTMFPALRIGFALLPPSLKSRWLHRRTFLDVQSPLLEQAALALFLRERLLDRHVRRMRRIYGTKRQTLLTALETAFGDNVRAQGEASGLHTAVRFPEGTDAEALEAACRKEGIGVYALTRYAAVCGEADRNTLLLGYGHLEPEAIREGIAALGAVYVGIRAYHD